MNNEIKANAAGKPCVMIIFLLAVNPPKIAATTTKPINRYRLNVASDCGRTNIVNIIPTPMKPLYRPWLAILTLVSGVSRYSLDRSNAFCAILVRLKNISKIMMNNASIATINTNTSLIICKLITPYPSFISILTYWVSLFGRCNDCLEILKINSKKEIHYTHIIMSLNLTHP